MMHWWAGGARSLTPAGEQRPDRRPGARATAAAGGSKDLRGRWENLKQSSPARPLRCPGAAPGLGREPRHHPRAVCHHGDRRRHPAAAAYTAKLLINSVVLGIAIHNFHQPDRETFAQVCACSPIGPFQTIHFNAVG